MANAAFGLTEERNGIEWTYYVQGDRAVIDGASMPDGTEVYGSVVVPSELGGYRVRAIDGVYYSQLDGWHGVFSSCVGIRYVEIPDGIEIVGDHSFKNCVALKTVVLGKDVVSIGVNAFSGCKSLKKMVLPNGLESIGDCAFADCSSLGSIDIPDSVTSLGVCSFAGCHSATSLKMSNQLVKIPHTCFGECYSLFSVVIPDSVAIIDYQAFANCTNLISVKIGENIASIGEDAFGHIYHGSFQGRTEPWDWDNGISGCCRSMREVLFLCDEAPYVDDDAFYGVPDDCCAYVKRDSVDWGTAIPGRWKGIDIYYIDAIVELVVDGKVICQKMLLNGEPTDALPVPQKQGYSFVGWFTEEDGGVQVTEIVPGIMALYAHWRDRWFVSFDPNGGVMEPDEREIAVGDAIGELPEPVRDGCTFGGWWTSPTGGVRIMPESVQISDATYYARWLCYVKFVANGGSLKGDDSVIGIIADTAIGKLPCPVRKGYKFLGWFVEKDGGTQVTDDTVVMSDMTLYARWIASWTLTFKPNGGSLGDVSSKMLVQKGKTVATFPTPKRTGYKFKGWYTKKSGGTKVTTKTKIKKNTVLYAHWEIRRYVVQVVKSGRGKISGTGTKSYNQVVTLKATPADGYIFMGWYDDNNALVSIRRTLTIVVKGNMKYKVIFKNTKPKMPNMGT